MVNQWGTFARYNPAKDRIEIDKWNDFSKSIETD